MVWQLQPEAAQYCDPRPCELPVLVHSLHDTHATLLDGQAMSEHTSAQLCPMHHAAACSGSTHHVLGLRNVKTWQQLCSMQAILHGVIRWILENCPRQQIACCNAAS